MCDVVEELYLAFRRLVPQVIITRFLPVQSGGCICLVCDASQCRGTARLGIQASEGDW